MVRYFFGVCAVLCLAVVALPCTGHAQERGYHQHDGFFLRTGLGVGYATNGAEDSGTSLEFSGASIAPIFLDLGWALGPNFTIHASMAGWTIVEPEMTLTVDGDSASEDVGDDITATVILFGGGATYYFAPSNAFVTLIVGATKFYLEKKSDEDDKFEMETGFGARVVAGKEWWASTNWGLGVAGYLDLSRNPDKTDSDVDWDGVSLGVLFTASYQ